MRFWSHCWNVEWRQTPTAIFWERIVYFYYSEENSYQISMLIMKSARYFYLSGAQNHLQTDKHFVRQNEIIKFQVLLSSHFPLLNPVSVSLFLKPLRTWESQVYQSWLNCSPSSLNDQGKEVLNGVTPGSKPDLCWTSSIIHMFSRLCPEINHQISSLLALNG